MKKRGQTKEEEKRKTSDTRKEVSKIGKVSIEETDTKSKSPKRGGQTKREKATITPKKPTKIAKVGDDVVAEKSDGETGKGSKKAKFGIGSCVCIVAIAVIIVVIILIA
ncbi:MAG: hypothetical protein GF308_18260 [Candidatus Heimdallarchaeota archaeon]|nr:hypothetical protein [Candidatus Heimdallarchaeota archaeon]